MLFNIYKAVETRALKNVIFGLEMLEVAGMAAQDLLPQYKSVLERYENVENWKDYVQFLFTIALEPLEEAGFKFSFETPVGEYDYRTAADEAAKDITDDVNAYLRGLTL